MSEVNNLPWADTLKKGDEVLVSGGYRQESIGVVEKQTAKQIVLVCGYRFWKKDLVIVGATPSDIMRISKLEDEARVRIAAVERKKQLIAYLGMGCPWREFTLETLEGVMALLEDARQPVCKE